MKFWVFILALAIITPPLQAGYCDMDTGKAQDMSQHMDHSMPDQSDNDSHSCCDSNDADSPDIHMAFLLASYCPAILHHHSGLQSPDLKRTRGQSACLRLTVVFKYADVC